MNFYAYTLPIEEYDKCVAECLPIETHPGYREHSEPVPLHGPDYSYWTLRKLLHAGMLDLNYEGTPFIDILNNWDRSTPLEVYLDEGNIHVLQLIISWHRVANKTPADYQIFPKFPFRLKLDRHCNFSYENAYIENHERAKPESQENI